MTSTDTQALRDDVAFLRNLVAGGDHWRASFGEGYFAAGVIYGAEMLLHAGQFLGVVPVGGALPLIVGLGPTLLFLAVILWIVWRRRGEAPPSSAGRAITMVFAVAGLANLSLLAVIGSVAWREHSLTTWLIYPCTVFVLQGAAWWVAYGLRRKAWLAWLGAGWIATAMAMAASVAALGYYVLFAAIGIWVLMAGPGWVMMRSSRAVVPTA